MTRTDVLNAIPDEAEAAPARGEGVTHIWK